MKALPRGLAAPSCSSPPDRRSTVSRSLQSSHAPLSLLGLLVFGIGFAFTSVWCWEVVGDAFTVAMYMDATPDETRR